MISINHAERLFLAKIQKLLQYTIKKTIVILFGRGHQNTLGLSSHDAPCTTQHSNYEKTTRNMKNVTCVWIR